MLEFFRTYQRSFFLVITVVVITSFIFFGTYDALASQPERKDVVIGQTLDGSALRLSEVHKLSRFISTDREDSLQGRGLAPNFCNDGVIRHDFLRTGLADLIVSKYFQSLKGDLDLRLDKAKRYKSYSHPDAPFLSAKAIWDHLIPDLNKELAALQAEPDASPSVFTHLSKLYQYQVQLQPEMLRRILIHQHKQYPWLPIDHRLSSDDLALLGFHSISDWFGKDFVDLISQFILNVAVVAEEKGYQVSLEESKGDLIHHFQTSMQKMAESKIHPEFNFFQHLRTIGFDEQSACECWRKVLLFRRYFDDAGESAFVDRLPLKDFNEFSKETAVLQKYNWPIAVQSAQDAAELQQYVKAVCPPRQEILPSQFLSVEEIEKKYPQLVQMTYSAQVARVSRKEVALRAPLAQVWDWEGEEKNWSELRKEFPLLPQATDREQRFKTLARIDPKLRAEIDQYCREKLLDQNPAWIQEALAAIPLSEKTWSIAANETPDLKQEGVYVRIEQLKVVKDKHILPFHAARSVLSKMVGKIEGDCPREKNPLYHASKQALQALQKDPTNSRWIQSGADPLADQFKLQKKELAIQRNSQENWMKTEAFIMLPKAWSPIQVADDGQIVFFYLEDRKMAQSPILEQLKIGKETLSADAKAYIAERLLEKMNTKHAIVIPAQKVEE